ncbi:hypothetical protein MHPYR_160136 [uncultured Mycobacterium sp.]|uniref:Aldehyde dehydrogenase domain-containing protein n=1 Tax=uncultured Mycobacterium sp. TaxID=171292 RepID=A0A1Y5PBV1_9MYCO|nr:hypothetical protein MHPYR_160136 [uncultured Mycobacterium sp.]
MSTAAQIFIDGQFRAAEAIQPVIEAATGEPLGDGASATEAEIDAAVAAAKRAFPGWANSTESPRAAPVKSTPRWPRPGRRWPAGSPLHRIIVRKC